MLQPLVLEQCNNYVRVMNKLLSGVLASGAAALGTAVGIWQLSDNVGDSCKPFAQCGTRTSVLPRIKHSSINSCSTQDKTNHAISESRKFIKRMMLEQGIPGVQVAVSRNGRLMWTEGLGLADVENGVACSAESVMRIASISKPLTTVGLFQLWEEGLIDLDAPVQTYVPSFPEKYCDGERVTITTRQLLCHMSGIRHYFKRGSDDSAELEASEYYITTHYDSLEESLRIFADDELLSKPGSKFYYSTHAWTLVSAVMEGVSGKNFLHYMQRNVFSPLGMEATKAEFNDQLLYNRARHYVRRADGKLQNVPYVDLSYKWAGGGLVSTAKDLVKFGTAVLASYNEIENTNISSKIHLSAESVKIDGPVTTNQIADEPSQIDKPDQNRNSNNPKSNPNALNPILTATSTKLMLGKIVNAFNSTQYPNLGYSLGWMVDEGEVGVACGEDSPLFFGHTGSAIGGSSVLLVFPDMRKCSELNCDSCGLCDMCEGREECGARGVVVCVLFNLQGVNGVVNLGNNIAKQFL